MPERSHLPSLAQTVLDINQQQVAAYIAADYARRRWWAIHPTFFSALKCMDGRLNLSRITQMPIGLVKPFRSLGGRFEIYWPAFIMRLRSWVSRAVSKGSYCCIFVTYHYSASDNQHLGCAGWQHDAVAAKKHAVKLSGQLRRIFLDQVIPIVTGIETDKDTLILHGPNDDVRGDLLRGCTEDYAINQLRRAFGDGIPDIVIHDLVPFIVGNAAHVASLGDRPLDRSMLGHTERIITVGQGFEWLAAQERPLIINDATVDLRTAIKTAGDILWENIQNSPDNSPGLLFTSVPFDDKTGQRIAIEKSPGLFEYMHAVLSEQCPELCHSGRMQVLIGSTDDRDMNLSVLDSGIVMPNGNFQSCFRPMPTEQVISPN